ncbi:hypothetical protein Z043_124156, partial [Scleropages formosus]
PPEVFVFAKGSKNPENVVLHCLATGFYPKDVELVIYRKGVPLSETDGVVSTGVRPNGVRPERVNPDERPGETFQLRKFIEVSKSDNSEYSCEVKHRTLEAPIIIKWDVGHRVVQGVGQSVLKEAGSSDREHYPWCWSSNESFVMNAVSVSFFAPSNPTALPATII